MSVIKVESEITGTVWKVEVNPGDQVSEGDILLILESMKMEIPLIAPEDGVVKEIHINEGDVIQTGDAAVSLEV
ncbi:biotin/lipoyl-binding carrier protein [Neobacillus niacini]|uniref:biotin/lipoyl-binding carrier protein n=1 Tax=Neobacillus niacini TaxID=86668 RepID=UPI002FFF459C